MDTPVKVNVYQCLHENCYGEMDPTNIPPPTERPSKFSLWSEKTTWDSAEEGWGGFGGQLPKEGENVKILPGKQFQYNVVSSSNWLC